MHIILYFIFWIFIAWVDRLFFLLFASPESLSFDLGDTARIFWNGLQMDLSAASYICALPFLGYFIWSFVPKMRLSRRWIDTYSYVVLFVLTLLSGINVNLYPEWTDKVSKRAIDTFFESPKEVLYSAGATSLWKPLVVVICLGVGGLLLYRFVFRGAFVKIRIPFIWKFLSFFLGLFFLFSCIRGGYGTSPLNESHAYFSTVQFYNHAAVNTYWSLINDYVNSGSNRNPYLYFDDNNKRDVYLEPVFKEIPDSAYRVLTTTRPNIVLILLESFTADLVESLGGEKGVTPNLDRIAREGITFTNFYAAADRSDKGIIGLFSAFPAQGEESIIKSVKKHEKLHSVGQDVKSAGYRTSFYYGGQSEFYNFKSYMMSHGIDRVIDMHDFQASDNESSWGVFDEKVFNRMLSDLEVEKTPFFSILFTITNHEPYDLKGTYKFGKASPADMFKSTAYYTDSVVNDFLEKAKQTPWYANTLFVITADHGHRLPFEREITDPGRFRIPLILYGDVVQEKYRGAQIERTGGQVDIAATLLNQLDLSSPHYTWSRNLFNSTAPEYAFFNTKYSFGVVTPQDTVVMDTQLGTAIQDAGANDNLTDVLKAYNQKVFDEYLQY